MEELMDNIIHVIIATSFIIAVASVVSGFATGNVQFLSVLTSSIIVALLASILYVVEEIHDAQRKRR